MNRYAKSESSDPDSTPGAYQYICQKQFCNWPQRFLGDCVHAQWRPWIGKFSHEIHVLSRQLTVLAQYDLSYGRFSEIIWS